MFSLCRVQLELTMAQRNLRASHSSSKNTLYPEASTLQASELIKHSLRLFQPFSDFPTRRVRRARDPSQFSHQARLIPKRIRSGQPTSCPARRPTNSVLAIAEVS